jgi:hypothetical protein
MKKMDYTTVELFSNLQLARQCMDYQGIKCKNNECDNIWCPLHKRFGEK